MADIRLSERVVGDLHVITSPDVPGLYVAHADLETARRNVGPAVQMLETMEARRAQRRKVERRIAASA